MSESYYIAKRLMRASKLLKDTQTYSSDNQWDMAHATLRDLRNSLEVVHKQMKLAEKEAEDENGK